MTKNDELKSCTPERIWLQINAGIDGETTWCENDQFEDDVEYVRVDIATGDPNEPIEDGQYRWILERNEGLWVPARVESFVDIDGCERFSFIAAGEHEALYFYECELQKVGPVIQPPPNLKDIEK